MNQPLGQLDMRTMFLHPAGWIAEVATYSCREVALFPFFARSISLFVEVEVEVEVVESMSDTARRIPSETE